MLVDYLAWPLLVCVGAVIPTTVFLARFQERAHTQSVPSLDIAQIKTQIAITQTILLVLAILATFQLGGPSKALNSLFVYSLDVCDLILALSVLGLVISLAYFEAKRPLPENELYRQQLRKIGLSDKGWIGLTIYAGTVEELVYRGVLIMALSTYVSWPTAAAISVVLFGIGHLSSGVRGALFAAGFATLMLLLVLKANGILLAVCVHIAYDLIVAWMGKRLN